MTRRKAKSTSSLSTKQTSESVCLLKQVRTHDEHQPLITLVPLGAKSHSSCSRGKLPSTLQDFRDKSPSSVTDANSITDSYFESPTGMSNEEKLLQSFRHFYFSLLNDYAGNDNWHYIHRGVISKDGLRHRQTHQDSRGEGYANSLPHK